MTIPNNADACCCTPSGDVSPQEPNNLLVEYLFLDLKTCDRCISTDQVLDQVLDTLRPSLEMAGFQLDYHKILMETEQTARGYEFRSSPTIRVNGQDLCLTVEESPCGCCSDISGTDVECRVFSYKGKTYEIPPAEMLARGILELLFGQDTGSCNCHAGYEMPGNLKDFFAGKEARK